MTRDDEQILGGGQTFGGGAQKRDTGPQSLGDEATCAEGLAGGGPKSLGDEVTFGGGGGGNDDLFDDDMEIVDLAGRYKVEGVLGKGGMGEVLLATDTRLNRKVAIKRMLGDAARSRTAVTRFLTEAQSIAALNHPNIVQIYDYGRAADGPFLIMEYVEGNSLLDRCRGGALPLEEAIELTCQLCDGLAKAHAANIIHRDIKPANVLMTADGIPKLTDFGLAKVEAGDTGMTIAGAVLGTLDFMPPEQRRDAAMTDARSDLWSLAATLYQMVTGKSPKIIRFKDVPKAFQNVLEMALEDEKEERYQTAIEFRDALQKSLQSADPAPVVAMDLGTGECSECHTRNEASRKFCRECAASLRVQCLKCESEIPIWDKVCGDCGAKQPELIVARREEIDARRAKAESLRSEYAFDESMRIAREVAAIDDVRFEPEKDWACQFLDETKAEEASQQQQAKNSFAEAKTHRKAFDYPSAVHAIELIPEAMRTSEMRSYLQQLQQDHAESKKLIATIGERIQRRDLEGLLNQVNRAVEIQGDRADLLKLQKQLSDRRKKLIGQRDKAFSEAELLLSLGDAKAAWNKVRTVKTTELRASQVTLRDRLMSLVQEEDAIAALVKECNADGVLDADEVATLITSASAYLEQNPRHAKIGKMMDDLLARVQKSPHHYAESMARGGELLELARERATARQRFNEARKAMVVRSMADQMQSPGRAIASQIQQLVFRRAEESLAKLAATAKHPHIQSWESIASMIESVVLAIEILPHGKQKTQMADRLSDLVDKGMATALSQFQEQKIPGHFFVELSAQSDFKKLSFLWAVGKTSQLLMEKGVRCDKFSSGCFDASNFSLDSNIPFRHTPCHTLHLKVDSLSCVAAEEVAMFADSLDISNKVPIEPETMNRLAKHKGGSLQILGPPLKHDTLLQLDGYSGTVCIPVGAMSVEVAQILISDRIELWLDIDLNDRFDFQIEAAEVLNRFDGRFCVSVFGETLTPAVAGFLSLLKAELTFYEMTALSDEVAEKLSRHVGRLRLDKVVDASRVALDILTKHTGPVSCESLERFASGEITKAEFLCSQGEYAQAIKVLSEVQLRDKRHQAVERKVRSEWSEAKQLLAVIKQKIKNKDLGNLLPLVDRACDLMKNRRDLRALKEQLEARSNGEPK